MTASIGPSHRPSGGWHASGLPLAFWGARHHPDPAAREAIAHALADWAGLPPDALLCDDAGWLPPALTQRETVPFELGPDARGDAAALARLLFSPTVNGSRLRVASTAAWLGQFGLTLTRPDRGYLVASGLDAAPTRAERAVGYLNPIGLSPDLVEPMLPNGRAARVDAVVGVGSSGMQVHVSGARWNVPAGELAGALATQSAVTGIGRADQSLSDLGLGIEVTGTAVVVRPRSSEATIRLTAFMARGACLVLTPGRQGDGAAMRVVVRLGLPGESATPLRALATDPVPEVSRWLRIAWADEPTLPLELRLLLARHLPLHDDWIDARVVDALLATTGNPAGLVPPLASPSATVA